MQQISISHNEEGRRLDNWLMKLMPAAGLSFICKMIRKKNITVNDKKVSPDFRLSEGDVVKIFFADDTFEKFCGKDRDTDFAGQYLSAYRDIKDIRIVYEDEDFIFADKPSGVLSQKSSRTDASMNEWLVGKCLSEGVADEKSLGLFKPSFANRLDRNTSGLMLGGKSLKALQTLSELLKSRNMHKYYLCVASGRPDDRFPVSEEQFLDIEGFLKKDHGANQVEVYGNRIITGNDRQSDSQYLQQDNSGRDDATLKKDSEASVIRTGFRLLKEYHDPDGMLLEVDLHTGKSHQIRAQLSSLGHPIAGDVKYGNDKTGDGRSIKSKASSGRRSYGQLLHAYRVVFPELQEWPGISGKEFKTALPEFVSKLDEINMNAD